MYVTIIVRPDLKAWATHLRVLLCRLTYVRKMQRVVGGRFFSAEHQESVELRLVKLVHYFHYTLPPIAVQIAGTPSQNSQGFLRVYRSRTALSNVAPPLLGYVDILKITTKLPSWFLIPL